MSNNILKDWLHRPGLTQSDKLLAILSFAEGPVSVSRLLDDAEKAGVRRKAWANPSTTLSRTKGLAIHTGLGWEISNAGRQKLANDGLIESGIGVLNVAIDLRKYLADVTHEETASFLREAIRAYELGLYRSAVILSWMAAIYVLQQTVVRAKLKEFNIEAKRVFPDWKPARNADELGRMKESEFLNRLVGIGLIGANVKTSLKECLDRRNACGHPNSFKVGQNMTAAHIEALLLNVFKSFAN